LALPDKFIKQGKREEIIKKFNLDISSVIKIVKDDVENANKRK